MKTKPVLDSSIVLSMAIGAAVAADALPSNSDAQSKTNATPTKLPEVTVREMRQDPTAYAVPNAATATKTDTPILETPASVQVVPQQVLKDQQVVRIEKALQNVSGVYQSFLFQGVQPSFTVRGFDNGAMYRDGVRVTGGYFTSTRQMANIDRVEVLKGPASILFGRIEPGGLINLVTKQPQSKPSYAVDQQIGSYDSYRTTLDATGPLTTNANLLYRANLAYENNGSFIEFLHDERFFVGPEVQWNLSEKTRATFFLEYQHNDLGLFNGLPILGTRPAPIPRGRNLEEPGARLIDDDVWVGITLSHDFTEQWSVSSRLEFNDRKAHSTPQSYATDLLDPLNSTEVGRFTEYIPSEPTRAYYANVDLTGKLETFGLLHTLLLGGDYYQQRSDLHDLGYNTPSIDLYHPVHTGRSTLAPADLSFDFVQNNQEDWYGAYAQDQVALPHDVHVLAGFRYDLASSSDNGTVTDPTAGTSSFATSVREDALKPRFGLLWLPIPTVSLYGSYTENFGLSNGRNADGNALPPTTAEQWEVGVKTELFKRRLVATLAWFDLTKQNIAAPNPNRQLAAQGYQVVTGEARNRGLELDLAGEPWPGLRILANYSYIDSRITKDTGLDYENVDVDGSPAVTAGNTGHRFFAVPRHAGSLWTTYTFSGLTLGGGVVARSQQEGDNANSFQIPGYVTLNLMGGYEWKMGGSKLSAQINVDNLLDKNYYAPQGGSRFAAYGPPRMIVGSVRMEF